jgi:hypothetical protein
MGSKWKGVISLEVGPPVDMHRTKGYDMGIVLQVETPEHLESFAASTGHLRCAYCIFHPKPRCLHRRTNRLHELREALSEDSLAFNLVF